MMITSGKKWFHTTLRWLDGELQYFHVKVFVKGMAECSFYGSNLFCLFLWHFRCPSSEYSQKGFGTKAKKRQEDNTRCLLSHVCWQRKPCMFQNLDKLKVSKSLTARKRSLCSETSQGNIVLWDVLVSMFKNNLSGKFHKVFSYPKCPSRTPAFTFTSMCSLLKYSYLQKILKYNQNWNKCICWLKRFYWITFFMKILLDVAESRI